MVSVSQIQTPNVNSQIGLKRNSNITFRGVDPKVILEVTRAAKKQSGIVPWLLDLANKSKGEIGNAYITAAGTALIAPLVIAYHPFSKADKETKQYSAWRQPISAVLQLGTQLYINTKYNNFLEQYASTGKMKFHNGNILIDMKANPADSYVEKLVKLKYPGITPSEFEEKVIDIKTDLFKKVVAEKRDEFYKARIAGKPAPIDFDKHPELLVGRSDLESETEKIKKSIKKEIEELTKADSKANATRINELKEQLSKSDDIAKQAMVNAKERIQKDIADNVQKKIRLREIASDFINLPKEQAYDGAIKKAEEKLAQVAGDAKESKIWKDVIAKLENIKEYEFDKYSVKRPFDTLVEIGKSHDEVLTNVRIKQFVKAQGDVAKHMLQQTRLWTGIGIGLAILPISCWLLNWTYPRLMEKIMPEVAQKQKLKKQQEMAANNNRQMEVKA